MKRQGLIPQGFDLCMFAAGTSPDGSMSDFVNVETLVPVLLSVTIILAVFAIAFSVCRLFANRRKLWWSDCMLLRYPMHQYPVLETC